MDENQDKLWSLLSLSLSQNPSPHPNYLLFMPSASSLEAGSFSHTFPNQYFGPSAVGYQQENPHCSLMLLHAFSKGLQQKWRSWTGWPEAYGKILNQMQNKIFRSCSSQLPPAVISRLSLQPSSLILSSFWRLWVL